MDSIEIVVDASEAELAGGIMWATGVAGIEERSQPDGRVKLIAGVPEEHTDEVAAALRLGQTLFAVEPPRPADLVVSGQANLVDPKSADPDHLDRMRHLLRTLEDKAVLLSLLNAAVIWACVLWR